MCQLKIRGEVANEAFWEKEGDDIVGFWEVQFDMVGNRDTSTLSV